jgi:DNA-binding response OmpR family regulator
MEKALWIGPRHTAKDFKPVAAAAGLDLVEFDSVDTALSVMAGIPIPVAIVAADWGDASPVIKKLTQTFPTLVVFAATKLGVPMQIVLAMNSGAVNMLDLAANDHGELTRLLNEGVARHRRRMRERELLLRLRALNEDFLKNMVTLEQRNIQLEKQVIALESDGSDEGPGRVLVVDDEAIVCEVVGSILEQNGMLHASAETGRVALTMLAHKKYDVVITDKNLPDMTGLDVLREIKKSAPQTAVIVVTGYASKESAIEALNLGADAYFEKPFDITTISDTVKRVLEAKRARAQKQQYLSVIKQRNREFLEQYRSIRQELETALQHRALVRAPGQFEE